jgi:hypothetical protein
MIETGSHTVLVYVKLQFQEKWSRFNGAEGITYSVVDKSGVLLVVTEDENSAKTTYEFILQEGHEVWVIGDVVHIPAICIKSAKGDEAKCRG